MIRFTPHAGASLRLGLLASACALLIGCTTPVAVRSLSAELVLTQRTYAASLHSYFGAVEKFADAQQRIAEIRIDEIAHEINRQFGRRANGEMAGAATPEAAPEGHRSTACRCRGRQ